MLFINPNQNLIKFNDDIFTEISQLKHTKILYDSRHENNLVCIENYSDLLKEQVASESTLAYYIDAIYGVGGIEIYLLNDHQSVFLCFDKISLESINNLCIINENDINIIDNEYYVVKVSDEPWSIRDKYQITVFRKWVPTHLEKYYIVYNDNYRNLICHQLGDGINMKLKTTDIVNDFISVHASNYIFYISETCIYFIDDFYKLLNNHDYIEEKLYEHPIYIKKTLFLGCSIHGKRHYDPNTSIILFLDESNNLFYYSKVNGKNIIETNALKIIDFQYSKNTLSFLSNEGIIYFRSFKYGDDLNVELKSFKNYKTLNIGIGATFSQIDYIKKIKNASF